MFDFNQKHLTLSQDTMTRFTPIAALFISYTSFASANDCNELIEIDIVINRDNGY